MSIFHFKDVINSSKSPGNIIENIDVSQYLVLKKENEDGPEVKGGYPDALIVHASKVQKNSENGK